MKKVLILSYFFPPCNLTAAQRIGNWEKHMHKFGYYPIIVTRNWTGGELTESNRLENSGKKIRLEKKEKSEIHYLGYKSSLRDSLFIKSRKNILYSLLSKTLTAFNLIFQNVFSFLIPYNNLYHHTKNYLNNNKDIRLLIISANPFEQFFFGYLLKKEFTDLKWIADYRDDWTTTDLIKIPFKKWNSYFEKKWVKTASYVTSVSPYYTKKISIHTQVKGHTIFNGFDCFIENTEAMEDNNFIITYNGTLYKTQEIEIFLEGYIKILEEYPNQNIHLNFPGLLINPSEANRIKKTLSGHERNYTITNRLPRQEVLSIQQKSDLLLMVGHKGLKGIPSSKIFEYISLKKPFIVSPGDNDILDEIAKNSSLGYVLNSSIDVFLFLEKKIKQKKIKNNVPSNLNIKNMEQYSVSYQVKNLCAILDSLLDIKAK